MNNEPLFPPLNKSGLPTPSHVLQNSETKPTYFSSPIGPTPHEVSQKKSKVKEALFILGLVVVFAIFILGLLYFWGSRVAQEQTLPTQESN